MSYCTNSMYAPVSLRAWQDNPEQNDMPWDEDGTQLGLCVVCGRGDALDDAGQCYDCLTTSEAALLEVAS